MTSDPLQDDPNTASGPIEGTPATRTMSAEETGGTVIGRYHLLQKIGEGGMGEVWLAEQKEPVRRRVALKLIKAGMNSREVIARFESERQALALMDHPAIAKVLDAGSTPQGSPYFIMEYVAGVPITVYCDNHRLGTRDRLELFIHVCEGVQHAHQKAIIHRDLKPSNILVTEVDGKPAPKIIDFGVAKALTQKLTADTLFTRVGAVVGTPEYMSPEQALSAGEDIDTRTDVYSLGIVFYELLAGAPPLDLRHIAFEEFLRRLREEDPPKPSTKIRTQDPATSTEVARKRQTEPPALAKQMRGDLDCIALKSLEKDRSRRYGSPSDFAADIGRYLRSEAVLAVPPSSSYRARKFAHRYRGPLITACAFALVLIAAAVISIRQSIRANRETAFAQAVNDFLQNDLLAQASAANQPGLRAKPDPDLKVRTALDRAAAGVGDKFKNQPEIEASIRATIGSAYLDLGLDREARRQWEGALELQKRVLGPGNPATIRSMNGMGTTLQHLGKYADAAALLQQAVQIGRGALGPNHRQTLRAMDHLANVYISQGKYAESEALYKQTVETRRRLLGPEHPDTLMDTSNLASVYNYQSKYAQAEALEIQLLEIDRRVTGPEHPQTINDMDHLGVTYLREGKLAQAEESLSQAAEMARRAWGPEHPTTLALMIDLALVYAEQGRWAQSEALDAHILESERHGLGPEHPEVLTAMNNLARDYGQLGKHAEAEALYSQTVQMARGSLGPEHPTTLTVRGNLAFECIALGNYAQAGAIFEEILAIQRRALGMKNADTLMSMNNLANVYSAQRRYAQAEALYQETLAAERGALGPENPLTLYALADFAFMYQRQSNYLLAETYAAQALAGRRRVLGNAHPDTMLSIADLALAYISEGKFAESAPLAREALDLNRKKQPDDWQRFRAQTLLGAGLAGQKQYAAAEPLLLEGCRGMLARQDRIEVPNRYHLDRAREWLAQMYKAWGKPAKAVERM